MALINCPECKKEVSDSAKSCPHCGYQLIDDSPTVRQTQKKKPKKKYRGLGLLLFVIAVVIIAVISSIGGDESSSPSSSSMGTGTSSSDKFLAYNYAEGFVKEKLKSPRTAKFPRTMERSEHITALGGGKFRINSWVDSQNSFGATIRTNFRCVITFEGETVRCTELIFDD